MSHGHFERLSGLDASFLLLETPSTPTHVASTLIFEAGPLRRAGGGIDFEAIERAHAALIHRIPRYRQVVRFTPLTGQPVWVDDVRFDLSYHLRHTALPRPGSEEELKRLSARIMQQPLDRARPLWETWVIEGVEGNRFALISKIHHCMVDGLSGIDLLQLLLSATADASLPSSTPTHEPRPEPSSWELLREDLVRRARMPIDAARDLGSLLRSADDARHEVDARIHGLLETVGLTVRGPSESPLNAPLGPHRRFDWLSMELEPIFACKRALGVTVNDVVLGIAAGAFRRFLSGRGEDPSSLDFRALAPVSVRRDDERGTLGNRVSGWIVRLPLEEADAKARLQRIAERTGELKASKQALGAELLTSVLEWAPATLLSLGARAVAGALPFNTIVTNVPGPRVPMYLLGARLVAVYPQVPLVARVGLGIALVSYAGKLHWGVNADYGLVPDLRAFVRALEASFDELCESFGAAPRARRAPRTEPTGPEPTIAPHHRRLTDAARERHDALTSAIEHLDRALAAPGRTKRWAEQVGRHLDRVREAIRQHVEGVEEDGGLFEEIQGYAPRLSARVDALAREHGALAERAEQLASQLPGDVSLDFASLRRDAAELLAELRSHRSDEADLVYEAFWTDLGAGD